MCRIYIVQDASAGVRKRSVDDLVQLPRNRRHFTEDREGCRDRDQPFLVTEGLQASTEFVTPTGIVHGVHTTPEASSKEGAVSVGKSEHHFRAATVNAENQVRPQDFAP
jgi:hypothetical protein